MKHAMLVPKKATASFDEGQTLVIVGDLPLYDDKRCASGYFEIKLKKIKWCVWSDFSI